MAAKFRIARIALGFAASLFFLAAGPAQGTSDPSWFPKQSCKQAWAPIIPSLGHIYRYGSDTYESYAKRVKRRDCYKDWTVLVYMAADNDLTPYAFLDLYEMEAGYSTGKLASGSTLKSDWVVQLDTAKSAQVKRLHMFQTAEPYDTRLTIADFQRRAEGDVRSPVVMQFPESTQDRHQLEFQEFLDWGVREYPAKQYMVIVWGHGQGWAPSRKPTRPAMSRYLEASDFALPMLPAPRTVPGRSPFNERVFGGIAFDDSTGGYLDIPALRSALREVTEYTLEGKPIDVYASDACLMQMIEVANELSPVTRYIVGSTQVQNFLGLPYRKLMFELNTGSFMGLKSTTRSTDEGYLMAMMIPPAFRSSFQQGGLQHRLAPEGMKTITMSSVSSWGLRYTLLPALQDFSDAMLLYLREDSLRAMDVQFVIQNTPGFLGGAQDLGVFLGMIKTLLREEAERTEQWTPAMDRLEREVDATKAALQRTALSYAFGTDYINQENQLHLLGFKALSIWLPLTEQDYRARIGDFKSSELYRTAPSWSFWLERVFAPLSDN